MNEQATPDKEMRDELDIPELNAPSGDEGELLEPIADDEIEVINAPEVELPDDPSEAVPVLLAALGDAQADAAGYLETVQRVAAEFENFRKRAARERQEIIDRASQRLIERLLPTLDSFDGALAYEPQSEGEEKLLTGMRDTHRQLLEALAAEGFEPIVASGVPFDPAIHEAVTGPAAAGDGDLIVQEMRRGYTLRGRVVRAALVSVEHA